jgi:hypothetical protein
MLAYLIADVLPVPRNFEFTPDPEPYIALFAIGFLIGVFGHIISSKTLVAAGIIMVFLSTVLLPVAIYLSQS